MVPISMYRNIFIHESPTYQSWSGYNNVTNRGRVNHTAPSLVSWPKPQQWQMNLIPHLMMMKWSTHFLLMTREMGWMITQRSIYFTHWLVRINFNFDIKCYTHKAEYTWQAFIVYDYDIIKYIVTLPDRLYNLHLKHCLCWNINCN